MKTIFVQIKTKMGRAYEAAQEIVEMDGVSEVYSTSGHYDLMVKCHLANHLDIGHFVTRHLQQVGGIQATSTIIAFNAFS